MKQEIKIGIVEDELLIAEKIKTILMEIGYTVCEPVSNFNDAIEMFKNEKPDIALLDINLGGGKDGIDIAKEINKHFSLPFIFLTANSDGATIERAKEVKPFAYLVKPFTKDELFVSIEIAFNNYSSLNIPGRPDTTDAKLQNYIFIRDGHRFIKLLFENIVYLESRENYVVIHTTDKKNITLRSTFNEFLAQLPAELFFRIHRSYAVHTAMIEHIESTEIVVAGHRLPLSNSYRQGLFSLLDIK